MNLIKTMLLVFCSLLVTEGLAYAYIGPGLGLGSIGLIIGFFLSIFLAVFALVWTPIKAFFKKLINKK